MPTNYIPNGTTQVNGLTWDDRATWVINTLPTGRFVWVLNSQTASPIEVMSGDPVTGALTIGTFTVGTLSVPTMKVDTLTFDIANSDVILARDAANALALRNGLNAQTLNIYNTFTSAANFERVSIGYVANALTFSHNVAGAGTANRAFSFLTNGGQLYFGINQQGGFVNVNASGHLVFGVDNNNDIGTSGAVRPRNLFLAGPTVNGAVTIGAGGQITSNALTNGQLLIGSTGAAPVAAGLTAGTGISVTNAAGSITVASTASNIFDRAFAVTVGNTGVETNLYSKSVTGNTLGAQQKFRLTLLGRVTDTTSDAVTTNQSYTLRYKFGATTLVTQSAIVTARSDGAGSRVGFGSNQPFKLVFELQNLNATNSQVGEVIVDTVTSEGNTALAGNTVVDTSPGAGGTAGSATDNFHRIDRGTSAVDTTAAQTLAVTFQWVGGLATSSFTMDSTIVEQL